ncbi:unnamed protein product [Cochlearia groenlandica]
MARLQERWRRVARATLLWNLNLASATILFGARASSLLGVLFTGLPRCSVISASGKQNYRAFPAPDNKTLGARLLSAILGTNVSRCSASVGFRATQQNWILSVLKRRS